MGTPIRTIGIDGEGLGRDPHRYTLLAYSDSRHRSTDYIECETGLSTVECLDFILSTPKSRHIFAYAFNYDLTKILQDVDDDVLYRLFRPDERPRLKSDWCKEPKPEKWNGYTLNIIGRKFVVAKGGVERKIWDIFAFYQCKFTKSLRDWKILPDREIDEIEAMKNKRSVLETQTRESIREYCLSECAALAGLSSALVHAHNKAGLNLRSYHGAGSTATAMFIKHGITRHETPPAMMGAVASAFFGGRFENAYSGVRKGPVYGFDISSAYPYEMTDLPCLDCGTWELVDGPTFEMLMISNRVKNALVNYQLHDIGDQPWGPLPLRTDKGSIVFPRAIGNGWTYLKEFLTARKLYDKLTVFQAWVYHTECCHTPFDFIPHYYRERLKLGKSGKGQPFKLGPNAGYGKISQSLGDKPPFQCWIHGGMITSGTRAQQLEVLLLLDDRWSLLMMATDGNYCSEDVKLPYPRETGTGGPYKDEKGEIKRKPLGGWERTPVDKGIFLARPGIYFPLDPTEEEVEKIRARGVGRQNLFENWETIVSAHKVGMPGITIAQVERFHGAKSSISKLYPKDWPFPSYTRYPRYGEWNRMDISVSFSPLPKRSHIDKSGFMPLRNEFGDATSVPYKKSLISEEAVAEMLTKAMLLEQPDADLLDIELDDGL